MILSQLMTFVAVAKHLNLTKASRELHVSQPSVSRHLRNLEDKYKFKLYRRTGIGIELTQEGRAFLANAENLLSQLESMTIRWSPASRAETLTVGGSYGPSALVLPYLLALFRRSRPELRPVLRTHNSPLIQELVLKSEVEIGLITAPSYDSRLAMELFRKERLVIFASANHPLAKRAEITPAELASAPLVLRQKLGDRGGAGKIFRQLEQDGLTPNIVMRCESVEGMKTHVKIGAGLGMMYQDMIGADLRAGELKIIRVPKLDFEIESFIVYRKGSALSDNAKEFLYLLRKWRHRNPSVKQHSRLPRNGRAARIPLTGL